MIAVIAGRVSVSKRLNRPRAKRNHNERGAAIIARQVVQETSPGRTTNGILGRRAIQRPRASDSSRPNPERPVGSARCQFAALGTLMPIVGAFVRMPAVSPLRTE